MNLSIITINYNNKDGLQKTIDSVVGQTFIDFEWIIIDGGSTDGSKELIKQYTSKISYWVSEPDNGIYNAMNKGLCKAMGDYCLFLNSGDYLASPSVLESVFDLGMEEDIVFGFIKDCRSKKEILNWKKSNITLVDLLQKSLPHPASFIRRELFNVVGSYDEKYTIVADWKFFLQAVLMYNVSIKYVPIAVSFYDCSGLSSEIKRNHEYYEVLREMFPPRVLTDLSLAVSLSEIYSTPIARLLYAILYRFNKMIRCCR